MIIRDLRQWTSRLASHSESAGSPESKGVTAGTSNPFERPGRRGPEPRAAPGGAAAGTYDTFERLPGAPPSGRPLPRRGRAGRPRRSLCVIRPRSGPPTSIGGRPVVPGQARHGPPTPASSGSHSGPLSYGTRTTPPLSRCLSRSFSAWRFTQRHDTTTVRSHTPEPDSPPLGGESGWERPPSDLRIYSTETRRL